MVDGSKMPTPRVSTSLKLVWGGCPWWGGQADACTDQYTTIWIRPKVDSSMGKRFVLLHEVGHVFDANVLTDSDRARLLRIMQERQSWLDLDPGLFYGSARERFGDVYAACATLGPKMPDSQVVWFDNGRHPRWINSGSYGWDPSPQQHAAACRLIMAAGK